MQGLFKQAAAITNNNIILAIPMIIFVKIIDLYSFFSRFHADTTLKLFIASLTLLFMFGAFCAGWFYIVKEAINLSKKVFVLDSDRAKASFNLIKEIPNGIGKYFLSFIGVYIVFFFIQILISPLVYFLGVKLIGALDNASMLKLQLAAVESSDIGVASFVDSLSPEQLIFFGKWSLLFMIISSIVMFLLMLWIPEIIYKTSNPVVALWRSVVKLFKNFFDSVKLYLVIWFTGFLILFLSTFAYLNFFAYIVMSIVMFYFSVYLIVLVFLYYDRKYVSNEK